MVLLLLLLGLLLSPCLGQDDAVVPGVRIYAATPLEALLLEASMAHARGDAEQVLDLLGALEARLLAGEGMQAERAVSGLALLGATRLRVGDERGAVQAFRLMAGRFPGEPLCPSCQPGALPQVATPAPQVDSTAPAPAPAVQPAEAGVNPEEE